MDLILQQQYQTLDRRAERSGHQVRFFLFPVKKEKRFRITMPAHDFGVRDLAKILSMSQSLVRTTVEVVYTTMSPAQKEMYSNSGFPDTKLYMAIENMVASLSNLRSNVPGDRLVCFVGNVIHFKLFKEVLEIIRNMAHYRDLKNWVCIEIMTDIITLCEQEQI